MENTGLVPWLRCTEKAGRGARHAQWLWISLALSFLSAMPLFAAGSTPHKLGLRTKQYVRQGQRYRRKMVAEAQEMSLNTNSSETNGHG